MAKPPWRGFPSLLLPETLPLPAQPLVLLCRRPTSTAPNVELSTFVSLQAVQFALWWWPAARSWVSLGICKVTSHVSWPHLPSPPSLHRGSPFPPSVSTHFVPEWLLPAIPFLIQFLNLSSNLLCCVWTLSLQSEDNWDKDFSKIPSEPKEFWELGFKSRSPSDSGMRSRFSELLDSWWLHSLPHTYCFRVRLSGLSVPEGRMRGTDAEGGATLDSRMARTSSVWTQHISFIILLEDDKQSKCESLHSSVSGKTGNMYHICNIKNIFEMPAWVRSQGLKHLQCKSEERGRGHGGQGEYPEENVLSHLQGT